MALTSIHPKYGKLNVRTKFTAEHNKWNYANTRRITVVIGERRIVFALNKKKEKDMIEWIESHKPMQTTIKRLIRAEMEREKGNTCPNG